MIILEHLISALKVVKFMKPMTNFVRSAVLIACLSQIVPPISAQTTDELFSYHIHAAQVAARGGLPVIAAREYQAALIMHPGDTDILFALGGVLEQAGKYEEAMVRYREVIGRRPDFAPAHNALADLLEESGQEAAALAQYRQALALEPGNPHLHYNLAAALEDAGQSREANAEFHEALRLKPDFTEAREALKREATPAHPARSAPPLIAPYTSPSAETLLQTGRLKEAEAAFHVIIARQPRNADAHLGLGIALYADGQAIPARQEWRSVLGLGDAQAAARARRLLTAYSLPKSAKSPGNKS